jgi:hypothetical protein
VMADRHEDAGYVLGPFFPCNHVLEAHRLKDIASAIAGYNGVPEKMDLGIFCRAA